MKKGGVSQILTHSTFFFAIALTQAGLGHVPCLADRVAGEERIKHSPHTTVPKNLTSFNGLSRDDCRSQLIHIAVGIPHFIWHLWDFIVHIAGHGVSLDMVDRLELPIVAESDVVRWLFRPSIAADRAEVFVMVFDDVDPADTTAVWALRTQGNDIDHI